MPMDMQYPRRITDAIKRSDEMLKKLLSELRKDNHCRLNELYKLKSVSKGKRSKEKVVRNVELFDQLGYKPNSPSRQHRNQKEKAKEISGLYVFCRRVKGKLVPDYIGMSRTIFRRLRQHGWGRAHNQASLAYLMAKPQNENENRNGLPDEKLEPKKRIIRQYWVIILPEVHPYYMYFSEVYLAGVLKTRWNSFRTH